MTTSLRAAACLIVAATLALGAIACSDDDDDGDDRDSEPTTGATVAAVETDVADVTQEPGSENQEIIAADFSFTPSATQATVGEATTFVLVNSGAAPHTLTVYTDDAYTTPLEGADTGQVAPGAEGEFEVTFDAPGDFYFRCEVHPSQMQGEIEVS